LSCIVISLEYIVGLLLQYIPLFSRKIKKFQSIHHRDRKEILGIKNSADSASSAVKNTMVTLRPCKFQQRAIITFVGGLQRFDVFFSNITGFFEIDAAPRECRLAQYIYQKNVSC